MRHYARWSFASGIILGFAAVLAGLALLFMAPGPLASGGTDRPVTPPPAPPRPVQILVLGVDERSYDSGRSDTMLLAQVEPSTGHVRLLSIPRDTYVEIPEHGPDKANSAYAYGGADLAKRVISEMTGLPVEYYVKVNLSGFRHLVDLMGGIAYTVPDRMYYRDPYDHLVIDLKPGKQVLDGRKAEQFVRFRHDEIGDDLGRVHRQQDFLKAALQQALQPQVIPRMPAMLYTATRYVETDMPLAESARLLTGFLNQRDRQIEQMVLPGAGEYVDGISYFLPDEQEFRRIMENWKQ